MPLQVLPASCDLINSQCLYFPNLVPTSFFGKFCFVQLHGRETFICRLMPDRYLPSNQCLMSKVVKYFGIKEYPNLETYKDENVSIALMYDIYTLRKVSLTLVFKSTFDVVKWKERRSALIEAVQLLLQLFIITDTCIIDLKEIQGVETLGLDHIVVHTIGKFPFGRLSMNSDLNLRRIISMRTEACSNDLNSPPPAVGLETAHSIVSGLVKSKRAVMAEEEFRLSVPSKVLLIGPSGCGKKTLIKRIAFENKTVLLTIDGPELSRGEPGETEKLLEKKFKEAQLLSEEVKDGFCILLLQRVETMCRKEDKILNHLAELLDSVEYEKRLFVVATTSAPQLVSRMLRSSNRFSEEVYIGAPSEEERAKMLQSLCLPNVLSEEDAMEVALLTLGFLIADLSLLVRSALRLKVKDSKSEKSLKQLLIESLKTVEASSLKGEMGVVKEKGMSIDDLGGLSDIKLALQQAIQWPLLHPHAFERLGIKRPSGILLYGPPGCAKTSLARALAASCKVTFLAVSAADLYSPYVGDAEQAITLLFQRARSSSPTLLFIDEIDALVGSRGDRGKGAQERVLSSFLTEMDGVGHKMDSELASANKRDSGVLIVAATNRPQVLDSALLRPGRFDRLIYVPPPNANDRLEILKVLTRNMAVDKSVNLDKVAQETELFSGADLTSLCREAGLCALTMSGMDVVCIEECHWTEAMKTVRPSLSEKQIQWYNDFKF